MGKRLLLGLLAFLVGTVASEAAPNDEAITPRRNALQGWEFDFESGILWRGGHNGTPLNYILLPQILTLKTPSVARHALAGGELIMRSRFSLLLEPIVQGPETHYFGVTASGILEWWNATQSFGLFFSSGGGFGGMDSKGYEIKGAQGQDLNLNWFAYPGFRVRAGERLSASFGIYYQHISNGGMDKVNPGLDAVGPMLSLGWRF